MATGERSPPLAPATWKNNRSSLTEVEQVAETCSTNRGRCGALQNLFKAFPPNPQVRGWARGFLLMGCWVRRNSLKLVIGGAQHIRWSPKLSWTLGMLRKVGPSLSYLPACLQGYGSNRFCYQVPERDSGCTVTTVGYICSRWVLAQQTLICILLSLCVCVHVCLSVCMHMP